MRRALVVEDDEVSMKVFDVALQRRGFRVLQSQGAEEAVQVFRRGPWGFHLVVCDVRLPVTSGPELALKLAAIKPRLRVLFTSGTPVEGWSASDRSCLTQLGRRVIYDFLAKPFRIETLDAMVERLTKRNHFLRTGRSGEFADSLA